MVSLSLALSLVLLWLCHGFQRPSVKSRRTPALFGISEWRDNIFTESMDLSRKPICLLPFGYEEGLIQGQTKELRLYEDRFIKLFDNVHDNNEGIVGMGLLSEEDGGILSSVPICEIADYNRMGGEFGIFLTIRCVGRGELLEVTEGDQPYLIGICEEIMDKAEGNDDKNLGVANRIAESIESMINSLSTMEEKLTVVLEEKAKDGSLPEVVAVRGDTDRFYSVDDEGGEDEDDDSRKERYQEAYKQALESDTQGYISSNDGSGRSLAELTAVSWAVFCTESSNELDAPYRLQAMDTSNLLERLKLGLFLVNEKFQLVEDLLEECSTDGNNKRRDDEDEGFA